MKRAAGNRGAFFCVCAGGTTRFDQAKPAALRGNQVEPQYMRAGTREDCNLRAVAKIEQKDKVAPPDGVLWLYLVAPVGYCGVVTPLSACNDWARIPAKTGETAPAIPQNALERTIF